MKYEVIPDTERDNIPRYRISKNKALVDALQAGQTLRIDGTRSRAYVTSLAGSHGFRVSCRRKGDSWIVWKTSDIIR